MAARAIESISAAGCAHISPVNPNMAFKINRAGMKIMPCLLRLIIREILLHVS